MSMPNLRRTAAPGSMPVTLAEAKAHLRVDFDDENDLITGMIGAVVDHIDGKSKWLFRCLMPQTWRMTIDGGFPTFDGGRINLPLGPILAANKITSVEYVDTAGVTQTLASNAYRFFAADELDDAYILPLWGSSWPSTRCDVEAVAVTYVAGYADAANVPLAIKQAILLQVADLYKNREAYNRSEMVLNPAVDRLLVPYKREMV